MPRHSGIRTERYKLIHYPESGERELFYLAEDPDELRERLARCTPFVSQLPDRGPRH